MVEKLPTFFKQKKTSITPLQAAVKDVAKERFIEQKEQETMNGGFWIGFLAFQKVFTCSNRFYREFCEFKSISLFYVSSPLKFDSYRIWRVQIVSIEKISWVFSEFSLWNSSRWLGKTLGFVESIVISLFSSKFDFIPLDLNTWTAALWVTRISSIFETKCQKDQKPSSDQKFFAHL